MKQELPPFKDRAESLLDFVYRGLWHCPPIHISRGANTYWHINHRGYLSTYDGDLLTRFVLGAHHYCLRVSLAPSGPGMVEVRIHNRKGRDGDFYERHPTIQQAIESAELPEGK